MLKILFFEPDAERRQNCLQTIIKENHLIETDIIKLYDLDLILKHINSIKYEKEEEVYYYSEEKRHVLVDVIFSEFLKEDFEIESAKENEKKYEVIVSFSTYKYKVDNVESINKRALNGEVKFVFLKTKNDFKLENYQLHKIKFQTTITEVFNKFSKIMLEVYNEKFTETIQNILLNMVEPLKNIKIESTILKMMDSLNAIKPTFEELNIGSNPKLELEEDNKKRELKESFNGEDSSEEEKNEKKKKEE